MRVEGFLASAAVKNSAMPHEAAGRLAKVEADGCRCSIDFLMRANINIAHLLLHKLAIRLSAGRLYNLLLGSAGLGVVVCAMCWKGADGGAAGGGIPGRALRRLVLWEHGALQALGLLLGMLAALLAVLPVLLSPGAPISIGPLAAAMALVLGSGMLWTWAQRPAWPWPICGERQPSWSQQPSWVQRPSWSQFSSQPQRAWRSWEPSQFWWL